MSWGEVAAAVSALAVQWLANRATSADSHANRRMTRRAELRDAIHNFLDAVQEAESVADPASMTRSDRADSAARRIDRNTVLHKMWFRQRALEVIAEDDLTAASITLTETMRDALVGTLPEGKNMWQHLDGPRAAFLRSAHDALYDDTA